MPRKDVPKTRAVFEYPKASGVWWIHYHDADGQRHREKVGRRGDAIDLYKQRKADARAGKKLPATCSAAASHSRSLPTRS